MADYWTRPIQSDRMNANFGRCRKLGINPRRELAWGAVVAFAACVFLAGLWIATPSDGRMLPDGSTALSSASPIEPPTASRPSGLQSTFAKGEGR